MIKNVLLKDLILDFESGARPKGGSDDIPSLGGQHLNSDGTLKLIDMRYISNGNYEKMRKGKIMPNDILVVKDGATTGKVTFIDDTFPYEKAVINEHLFRIQVDPEKVIPQYIYLFLNSKMGKEEILKDFRGATVGGISRNFVNLVNVPLIEDLTQQEQVVYILEKVKKVIVLKNQQITSLSELKQSIFNKMFGDPIENSKYKKLMLKDIGSILTGNTPSRKIKEYYGDYIEWIKTDNITFNSMFPSTSSEYLSELGSTKGRIVEKNSILVACIAGSKQSIGKAVITDRNVAINQQINSITPNSNIIDVFFLYTQIQILKKYFEDAATSGMKGMISKSNFEKLEVIVPPLEKQKAFTRRLKDISKLENTLKSSLNQYNSLYSSLLEKAFTGELDFTKLR